jgi:hypothetical protein
MIHDVGYLRLTWFSPSRGPLMSLLSHRKGERAPQNSASIPDIIQPHWKEALKLQPVGQPHNSGIGWTMWTMYGDVKKQTSIQTIFYWQIGYYTHLI